MTRMGFKHKSWSRCFCRILASHENINKNINTENYPLLNTCRFGWQQHSGKCVGLSSTLRSSRALRHLWVHQRPAAACLSETGPYKCAVLPQRALPAANQGAGEGAAWERINQADCRVGRRTRTSRSRIRNCIYYFTFIPIKSSFCLWCILITRDPVHPFDSLTSLPEPISGETVKRSKLWQLQQEPSCFKGL